MTARYWSCAELNMPSRYAQVQGIALGWTNQWPHLPPNVQVLALLESHKESKSKPEHDAWPMEVHASDDEAESYSSLPAQPAPGVPPNCCYLYATYMSH